jgi:hypothetical protein
MSIELTEQTVAAMAPADSALSDARGLIRKGSFRALAKSEDGTLVFAECKGSAAQPYKVSLDFSSGGDRPTVRCNCPSRQRPCKHALGLGLAYVQKGAEFKVAQPPADLVEKRDKLVERKAKGPTEAKPRQENKEAAAKKAELQKDALISLEKFVVDLVTAGLGGINQKGINSVVQQANRLNDVDLPGARARLIKLASLLNRPTDDDDDDDDDDEEIRVRLDHRPMPDDERHTLIATQITQLWVAIRKGQRALEGKLDEGDSKSESDAQVELLLGRRWQLPQLKEAGYWATDRVLVELAHEQSDDKELEMASAAGYLLDLGDGSVLAERTSLPYKALQASRDAKLRTSRSGVLEVKEAALYPGDEINRRFRWNEKDPDAMHERPRAAADYAKLHGHAKALEPVLKAFRDQIKNPLLPHDAVFLVKASKFGMVGDVPVLEDPTGARLPLRDPRGTSYPTTRNFIHAAGAFGPGSVAVRLWFDAKERAVFGQALALFVGEKHLRLGM